MILTEIWVFLLLKAFTSGQVGQWDNEILPRWIQM